MMNSTSVKMKIQRGTYYKYNILKFIMQVLLWKINLLLMRNEDDNADIDCNNAIDYNSNVFDDSSDDENHNLQR